MEETSGRIWDKAYR